MIVRALTADGRIVEITDRIASVLIDIAGYVHASDDTLVSKRDLDRYERSIRPRRQRPRRPSGPIEDWQSLANSGRRITSSQWMQFCQEKLPDEPTNTVAIWKDVDGCWYGPDGRIGKVGYYRAAMLTQLRHPTCAIATASMPAS